MILIISFIYVSISSIKITAKPIGAPYFKLNNIKYGLSIYNKSLLVPYVFLNYSTMNLTHLNLTAKLFLSNPNKQIYVLNTTTYCVFCYNIYAFTYSLNKFLSDHGYRNASLINPNMLNLTPNNSIIIIGSGLMPSYMFNYLNSLFKKGDTIIYIGRALNYTVGPNGVIYVTPSYLLDQLPQIQYYPINSASIQINSSYYFRNMTFAFGNRSSGPIYVNQFTYFNISNGKIIAFSNYPTFSWPNVTLMAHDIGNLIVNRYLYIQNYGFYSQNLSLSKGLSSLLFSFSKIHYSPENVSNVFVVLYFNYGNSLNKNEYITSFHATMPNLGYISIPAEVPLSSLEPIYVSIFNKSNAVNTFSLEIINSTDKPYKYFYLGFFNVSLSIVDYIPFNFPPGFYIAEVKNFSNKTITVGSFYIAPVSIYPISMNFSNKTFEFFVSSAGQTVSNVSYSISINKEYTQNGTVRNGIIYYSLPTSAFIPTGNQTFQITIFNFTFNYSSTFSPKGFIIPPLYIEFFIALIVIVFLNVMLRNPPVDQYFIDVPSFPKTNASIVHIKKEDFMSVFSKVNNLFKWKYMPLTISEIKNGLSTFMRYNNLPLATTTKNLEENLDLLVSMGLVKKVEDYYIPTQWISESGHDAEYLVIFRKLRDYFVSHSLLFTELDKSDIADIEVVKNNTKFYIIIYSSESKKLKPIPIGNEKVFIVTLKQEVADELMREIHRSNDPNMSIIRLGIYQNIITIIPVNEISNYL